MGRVPGGIRTYKPNSKTYKKRMKEAVEMLMSGKYSSVGMGKGGGYLAIEKSDAKHKPDEIEAGKILADKGYKVILKNEAGLGLHIKTADGYLFSLSFEQRTPTKDSASNIRNALFHAKDKRADIALIYSKNHVFSKESATEGVRLYDQAQESAANPWYFKKIIVVADNGNVHKHKHHE